MKSIRSKHTLITALLITTVLTSGFQTANAQLFRFGWRYQARQRVSNSFRHSDACGCPNGICQLQSRSQYHSLANNSPETCQNGYCGGKKNIVDSCNAYSTCLNSACSLLNEYKPVRNEDGKIVKEYVHQKADSADRKVCALLQRVNNTRARYGLTALTYDRNLASGSYSQANYCAQIGALAHGAGVVEILAMNASGIDVALNQWLNSPAHRALLLNTSYRYAGVAVVRDRYGRVWCAVRFR